LLLTFAAASTLLSASPATADTWSNGHRIHGDIEGEYLSIGAGNVGYAVTDELDAAGGRFQVFERPAPAMGNSIYWSSSTGAHQVGGVIRDKWRDWGWETGSLGYPLTRETSTPSKPGAFNTFQGGSIYWSPGNGANEIGGLIRDKWANTGWENGVLGFPVTDEFSAGNGSGKGNHFQGGSIYWSPNTGAHTIWGDIKTQWANSGWENGPLGYPTSDEYDYKNGKRQDFQNGSLAWTPSISSNREAAINYADAHAFNDEPGYFRFNDDDCTNFASHVLTAGGLPHSHNSFVSEKDDSQWFFRDDNILPFMPEWSMSWINNNKLYDYLTKHTSSTAVAGGTGASFALKPFTPPGIVPGDLVFYDWDSTGGYDHVGVVTRSGIDPATGSNNANPSGKPWAGDLQDQHTAPRQGAWWSLYPTNTAFLTTSIKFVHVKYPGE
jgi:hypothetical protein